MPIGDFFSLFKRGGHRIKKPFPVFFKVKCQITHNDTAWKCFLNEKSCYFSIAALHIRAASIITMGRKDTKLVQCGSVFEVHKFAEIYDPENFVGLPN